MYYYYYPLRVEEPRRILNVIGLSFFFPSILYYNELSSWLRFTKPSCPEEDSSERKTRLASVGVLVSTLL